MSDKLGSGGHLRRGSAEEEDEEEEEEAMERAGCCARFVGRAVRGVCGLSAESRVEGCEKAERSVLGTKNGWFELDVAGGSEWLGGDYDARR
jgi:hypothetical protein